MSALRKSSLCLPLGQACASPEPPRRAHTAFTPSGSKSPRPRCQIATSASSRPWTRLLHLDEWAAAGPNAATAEKVQGAGTASSSSSGPSNPAPTSDADMPVPHELDEVYENQRFFGILWKPPLSVLDWPEWSDSRGNPVALARRPSDDPADWVPAVTPATDAEGWQYATVFKHLEYKRAGGRSSQRFGDTVRRRLWRRRPGSSAAEAPAVAVPAEGDGVAAAAAAAAEAASAAGSGAGLSGTAGAVMDAAQASRDAREAEAKRQAIKAFMSLVVDLLSRRQLWTLVPWDPAAIFLLWQKHQKVYQELQAQAYERRLFTADQEAPPSQLREGRTLLQDLICAAMHSRAAYGFPAAAGMMSTVADYIRLQTIQPLTFDAVGGVSVEANNESVAALAGIAQEDLLLAEWRNSPYRPCHYVAIDRANQCIVVSIRGTLQVGDLLSDLAAAPMEVDIAGADGWVHQGIFAAATFIHCNTQEALQEAARRCPGWPVLLTGHSLGGGTAALLTLLLQESGLPQGLGPMRCITMGTAAVMSWPLAEACNELVTSVILGSDVVPHLSYASVEAVLLEASEASPVRRTVQGWGSKLAGALSKSAARQQELSQAAAAAMNSSKIAGSWAAVKEASIRISKSASGSGLSRIASMVAEGASRGMGASDNGSSAQQAQQAQQARQIPVLQQAPVSQHWPQQQQQQQGSVQPAGQQSQQAQQGQQPLRMIPIIDMAAGQPPAAQQPQQQVQQESAVGSAAQPPAPGPGAAPISEMLPAADAAGLEGFFSEAPAGPAGQEEGTWAGQQGAQQQQGQVQWQQQVHGLHRHQQQGQQGEDVILPMCEFDSPAVETAMAAEAAAGRGPAPGGASLSQHGDPGNPELLYPPGRIIWIFPADEHIMAPAEAEEQLQAMDAAWQGGMGPLAAEDGDVQAAAIAGRRPQQQQQRGAAAAGSSRGQYELTNEDAAVHGRGSVNVGEAMEAVESGTDHSHTRHGSSTGQNGAASSAPGQEEQQQRGQQQQQQQPRQQQREPVAVDADRASFERLLLMQDMINDHLPDRIVAALQQL